MVKSKAAFFKPKMCANRLWRRYAASVKLALLRRTRGEDGRLYVTPERTSFEEIDGQINSSQDELDELSKTGRCPILLMLVLR
jgi:hypothetical protein